MNPSRLIAPVLLLSLGACASTSSSDDRGRWRRASIPDDRGPLLSYAIQDQPAEQIDQVAVDGPQLCTFSLRGGGQFIADFTSELRLDSSTFGWGTSIGLENDLGFDNTTEFGRLDATWRFNRHHAIDVSYFSFDRQASTSTDLDIVWGPITIPAGSGVDAFFDVKTLKASYRYTFAHGESWELGGAIGVHATRFGTGLSARRLDRSVDYSATLPLPVLGLRGTWEFTPDLRLNGLLDFFYLRLDDVGGLNDTLDDLTGANGFEGWLVDALVSLEYDVLDFLGVGVGANYFQIDASIGDDVLRLSADYHYVGGMLFARVFF